MGKHGLGEFEHQTMLALLRLKEEAYTAPIAEELETRTGRRTTTAAVYIVLRRLEDKGLVQSVLQDPGEEGGRDRRYFQVTELGIDQLRQARQAYTSLWEGLDKVLAKG